MSTECEDELKFWKRWAFIFLLLLILEWVVLVAYAIGGVIG